MELIMKKMLLLLVIEYVIYAGGGSYGRMLNNCNSMYMQYKLQYRFVSYPGLKNRYCSQLGTVDKQNLMIEDPQDEIDYLEYQKKTLGLACEQVSRGIEVSYKNEYCIYVMTSNIQPLAKKASEDKKFIAEEYQSRAKEAKVIDPSIQYKNNPQLIMDKLQIYGVKNISNFRDKTDTVLIESAIGRFAVPVIELKEAKCINLTLELTQKFNSFTQNYTKGE